MPVRPTNLDNSVIVLALGACGDCLDIFSHAYHISFSFCQYRLK